VKIKNIEVFAMTTLVVKPILRPSVILLLLLQLLSSCGLVQKVAVGTTSDLLFKSTGAIEKESNWELFREGVPGNLKMMEGLVSLEPKNEQLLVGLAKGFAGYAFAVSETLALTEIFDGIEDGPQRAHALSHYSRALEYGLRYLEENDMPFALLQESIGKENGVVKLLDKKLNSNSMIDLEGVLFTAQSLGALIVYQRDDMALISLLPLVKGMFDWVCTNRPDINFGACDIFAAAYEAGRPKALGGNPEKGKEIFLQTIKRYPANWLVRVTYMRFYLIPMGDEEGYNEQAKVLEEKIPLFAVRPNWRPRNTLAEDFSEPRLLLYQSIAMKQFETIKKFKKKLF
jgi:hypothetical protein